jgi:archaellum component FlaG (FlaF/FlaG flagellin family)
VGDGPSEIILLIAGLIVAALVSGVLLQSWDDMSGVLDERGKQGMEDVKTRVSLASDPINIGWEGNDTAILSLQNSGDSFLDVDNVGVSLKGKIMTVTKNYPAATEWLPGEVVEFTIDGTSSGLTFASPATHDVYLMVTVVSTSGSYAGVDTLNEEVRISA